MILSTTKINSVSFDEALKKVFLKLLKRKTAIVDDTCLQKLLDLISLFAIDVKTAESCGVIEFLKSIQANPNTGKATLVFGTQIAGCLAQNEEIFLHFEKLFREFYVHILSHPIWPETLSLKTALFLALKQTMQHKSGFRGLSQQLSDISTEIFKAIHAESSIFLTKSATSLLSTIITQSFYFKASPSSDPQNVSNLHLTLLNKCWDCIKSSHSTELDCNPYLRPFFLLLEDLQNNSKIVLPFLVKQEDGLKTLVLILINVKSQELAVQAVDFILELIGETHLPTDQEDQISDILNKLNKREHLKKRQTFIIKALKRTSGSEYQEKMIDLFCQPLSDIGSFIESKFSQEQNKKMEKRMEFSSQECEIILCHTIDCWMERFKMDSLKEDCIAPTTSSISVILLKIFGILAAKERLQISRHYQFLNSLATSRKLLGKILQFFCKLTDLGTEDNQQKIDFIGKLIKNSLLIIENVEQISTVVSLAFQCLLCYLPLLLHHLSEDFLPMTTSRCEDEDQNLLIDQFDDSDLRINKIPSISANIVISSLCHPKWEVRDTTVEFLSKIFASCTDSPYLLPWVKKHKLHSSVYSSYLDGESYVRASVITAITTCLQNQDLWSDFLKASNKSQTDILEDFIKILQTDTEAFPRRAAILFLLETHKLNILDSHQKTFVYKEIVRLINSDLDWEVKITSINLWENVIRMSSTPEIPAPAYALGLPSVSIDQCQACKVCSYIKKLEALSEIGCMNSLLTAFQDCDQSVRKRAGNVLSEFLCPDGDFWIGQPCSENKSPNESGAYFGCCARACCEGRRKSGSILQGRSPLLETLRSVDFETSLRDVEMNCDLYAQDPLLLIEDILADWEGDEIEDENKTVDCY